MSTDYVLDASAVVRIFLEQPGAGSFREWYRKRRMERCRFFSPDLLPYELANVLHRERGPSHGHDPDYLINMVRDAVQGIHLDEHAWMRTWSWATTLGAYDAAYAALAEAKQATLVTYDKRLGREAAKRVPVIGPDGLD